MEASTKTLIGQIQGALGEDFTGAVHESTGPDGIDNFFAVEDDHAKRLVELAIEDEAELGRIMAKQILVYLHGICADRNVNLEGAA